MENSVFPARTAVFDPCLSVYKSGDECPDFLVDWKSKSLWIFTGEGKFFSFSWKSILFVFWADVQSQILPKGQEF